VKREIITAERVDAALSQGLKELSVPPGGVITPMARDRAAAAGIALVRNAAGSAPAPGKPAPENASPENISLLAEIRTRVQQQLPEGADMSQVDALVRQALRQQTENAASPGGKPVPEPAWRQTCGGLVHVSSSGLPWQNLAGAPQEVNIIDAVTSVDGSSLAAGYMEWENASFDWRLTYDEVIVVLQGILRLAGNQGTLEVAAGDMAYLAKGSAVTFSSTGYVKFAYTVSPADWAEHSGERA